jgi:phosphoribosyl 1,2-cyclic phosphodiesterase
MLRYIALASGSKGNCHYITDGSTGVLIDCGIGPRRIFSQLEAIYPEFHLDAVFITHCHTDHVGAADKLERAIIRRTGRHVPFFLSKGTELFGDEKHLPQNIQTIAAGDEHHVGELIVEAFSIPHDAPETLAYRVFGDGHWAGVVTDLGHVPPEVMDKMRTLSILALEFNYDLKLLQNGSYPYYLKDRVAGPFGHLSNLQAEAALREAASPMLQHLVLSHVSENNNTPELVYDHAQRALTSAGLLGEVNLVLAAQRAATGPFDVGQEFRAERTLFQASS